MPMDLQLGDHLTDETGEWEVIGRSLHHGGGQDGARPRAEDQ